MHWTRNPKWISNPPVDIFIFKGFMLRTSKNTKYKFFHSKSVSADAAKGSSTKV